VLAEVAGHYGLDGLPIELGVPCKECATFTLRMEQPYQEQLIIASCHLTTAFCLTFCGTNNETKLVADSAVHKQRTLHTQNVAADAVHSDWTCVG
jgi:hypothetical protein